MGCTIRITTLLLVFCTQGFIAYGSVQPIWSNPELAENILGSFTEYLLKSGIFSSEQIDDISSISQTILDAFGRSGFSNNISSSKTRALNMALASSVAELVLSENPSFPLSDIIRAITDGLRDSMLKNTGGVDEVSLKEINQLINMIAADRLNEGSDVSSRSEETQNAFDGTANAPGYDPSSSTSSQGYRPDTKPNDRYNARASGAERPFQRYGASQPTEVAAVTSQGFSDVSYRPANAEAFSQNVGLNTFGSTGDLGFGHDSTAVASANAPSYSDYYKQGGNRQAYPMATDRAPGDAGRDDQGFQESGYPVDIIRDNKATEFGQGGRESTGYAKAKGFPEASSDGAAANNIRQGYRNSYKDRVYNARRDSSIPTYGNDREIISSSRDIDVISKFTNTITSSLLSSNDFTSTFRSGLPVTNAVNLASNLARSFATQFGLDDTTINSLLSLVSQYISGLGPSADVSAYANAISRAIGDTIENTGNVSPILTTSLASADTKPIANLISSVTSATVNAQQPNLVPRIGGSNFKNLAAKQVQENRQNFPSVQSAVGTRIQPSLSRFPGQGANAAASGGGGQAAEIPSTTGDIDVISQFTNTITSSLLSSNDFTSTFVSGLPVTIALNLASNLAQSLASQIGLDEAGINSLLSLLSQYISAIDPSADASAYANAVSLAIGNTLANAGNVSPVLTASLASADTQQIANLISSVTSSTINAQKPNIIRSGVASTFRNVPLTQVQLNRGNVGAVQSSVATRLEPLLTRLPGQGSDAAASAADEVGQGVRTSATATNIDVISKFTNTISSGLLASNDFSSIFGSGLPVTTALNLASNLAQSLATQIGLDEAGINSLLSLLRQYILSIGSTADASTYANAVSLAIGNTLANAGNVSPALTASIASADPQPIANLVSLVTSSTLNTQHPNIIRSRGASNFRNVPLKQVLENRGNLGSVQSGQGAAATAAEGVVQGSGTSSTATDIDVISKFTNTISSGLLASNDFTSVFGSGLPVTTALNLASNLAQSLGIQIGLDEAAINSLLSLLSQYISAIDSSADASAYANALSLAIGNTLENARNVSPALTASLASADTQPIANLVRSVTSSTLTQHRAQQPNIIRSEEASNFRNVPLTQVQGNRGNVDSVQSSVGTRLQPSLSRFPGQSITAAASSAAGSEQGAGTSSTAPNIEVISKFTNTISSSLLSSNDFTSIFGSGLPVTTALNLASNLAQSLATQIGLDEAGIKSLLSLLRQYISAIGSSADASAYANAVSLAIGNTLANAGNISPTLTASLASTDIQPIANLVNSVTSTTLNIQQPNLIRSGGASAFSNVPLTQNQGNRGNLASVQSLVGKRFQPSLMRFRGQGATTAAAGVGQEAGISTATTDINVISKFANTISSSLLSSNEFTSIFGSGLPVTTALNLASNLAQSLATQIGLDEVGIKSLLSLLSQYISAIGSSADASAYANAVSLAIGNTLANVRNISPILTASLVSTDIQPIANLVNSVTSSTLSTQQPNLIRRGGASGLRSAVNSRLSRPGLITASPPVSGAAGAAISESGLIEQVNANPSAVSTAGIGNLAISSAATSSTTGLGGGSVSPASDVGSSAVSAPSSIDPSSRISSAASFMVSGRSFNPNALPSVISYLANQVRASAANLSDCEIVSQVLLETLSAVTHLLRYAVIDEVNYSDLANTASFIGQALG